MRKHRFYLGVRIVREGNAEDGRHARREDRNWVRARLPMPKGILAWDIQLMPVMRMLDRTDSQAPALQFGDELHNESGLAAILPTNDVDASQRMGPTNRIIFDFSICPRGTHEINIFGKMEISIKALKDPPSPDDGLRVLIDRAWPRGTAKAKAAVDVWAKSVAPSAELCKWFGNDAQKWREFKKKYIAEIDSNRSSSSTLPGAFSSLGSRAAPTPNVSA